MTARICCCVPFCRRTHKTDDAEAEWLCVEHYRLASAAARTEYDEAWKRADAEDKRSAAGDYEPNLNVYTRVCNAWAVVKAEAIEAAGGIG